MKLREKRVISLVLAMIVMFSNCLSTYGVEVDQYQYGSLFVIGQLEMTEESEANEAVSLAALKLGAVESSYIFASLDDSLITGDVLNSSSEDAGDETTPPVEDDGEDATPPVEDDGEDVTPPAEDAVEGTTSSADDSGDDATPSVDDSGDDATPSVDDSGDDTTPPADDTEDDATPPADDTEDDATPSVDDNGDDATPSADDSGDDATPSADDTEDDATPPVDDNGDDTTPPADDSGDDATPSADDSGDDATPPVDDSGDDETTPPSDDAGEDAPPPADDGEDATPPSEDDGEGTTPSVDDSGDDATPPVDDDGDETTPPAEDAGEDATPSADDSGDDATPPADDDVDDTTSSIDEDHSESDVFEVDFYLDNVDGFYYEEGKVYSADISYIDSILEDSGMSGEILGYYDLHSANGIIDLEEELVLTGTIRTSDYENVLIYYLSPYDEEILYETEYDEESGEFLVEIPVIEFANSFDTMPMIATFAMTPVNNSTASDFDATYEISEDNLAYFNANIFNYDARMYNFATRSKQLAKVLGVSEDKAAEYLSTAGNTDRTDSYKTAGNNYPSHAEAADYARASTKNTLLFNYDGNDEHYSKLTKYYDEWLKDHLKSNVRVAAGFNKPYLPQNAWTNQAITPGIVGVAGETLNEDGLPKFQYTEAGFFRTSNDSDRTLVSFDGADEEWLLQERLSVKFPFKKDGNYYVFDSATMYTDNVLSKSSGDKIKLYEGDTAPLVANKRGFWPFATSEDFTAYSSTNADSYLSDQYHFGMNLDAKFVAPKDLKVGGNDMIFEFSGDDDMWVYIDGKLALDVGGSHAAMTGSINFTTGEITYNKVLNYPSAADDWNTVDNDDKLFLVNSATKPATHALPKTDYTTNVKWNLYGNVGLNKADFSEGSVHTIEIFYLERGTGESNCKMRFNMSAISDIESEKTAYVYDDEDTLRELNDTDSVAYTGQDVYFELYVKNYSGQILNNVVVYDKGLKVLFDKNGIKKDVTLSSTDSTLYQQMSNFTTNDYDYTWEDSGISRKLATLGIGEDIKISETGIDVDGMTFGTSEDLAEIKSVLKRTTTKDVRDDEIEGNTMYVIGHCDEVVFGTPYIVHTDDIQYKVEDTRLYVRQVVEDGTSGEFLSNPKEALVDTVSANDTRSLYFPSNETYRLYTSYYNNVDYTVSPVVPSDYELIAIDVEDTAMKEEDLLDSSKYNGETVFNYTGEQYEKYVTIYLRKTENTDWHNSKAIVNEFDPIVID